MRVAGSATAAIGMPAPSVPLPVSSAASARVMSTPGMQAPPLNSFSSPNHPSQNVSGLSLGLPLSSTQAGSVSHAMPGGVSQTTMQSGISHGGVSQSFLAGVAHAMPLASSAAPGYPFSSAHQEIGCCLPKIKIIDIIPADGPPSSVYTKAVEELSACLSRHGAAILELGVEDAALIRCALESAALYFTRAQSAPWSGAGWSKTSGYVSSASKDMYYYRAGRNPRTEEAEQPPPGMPDVFRCLGKASRITLGAISRNLRLRSDVFYSLLDDCPLPEDCTSSSILVATHFHESGRNMKGSNGSEGILQEYEKGLLTVIAADSPGLQVCDANGHWYLADVGLQAGDLLVITGKSLQHVTAGVCRASAYRVISSSSSSSSSSSGRTSLTFRLMPRNTETLDGSLMADAGYPVSDSYGPVSVSKFMEGFHVTDSLPGSRVETSLPHETNKGQPRSEPSLRALLSDPLTGTILEDAFTSLGCGHSFGGGTFEKVMETQRCTCGAAVTIDRIIPNLALRAAAAAFKEDDIRRQHHIASRKRRKEFGDHPEKIKRLKELPGSPSNYDVSRHIKGVQYPFNVNEKVVIKGNKRTPEKFVGREAIVTSKCLNGWYLLTTLDNGESVRLQYRSLKACTPDGNVVNDQPQNAGEMNG